MEYFLVPTKNSTAYLTTSFAYSIPGNSPFPSKSIKQIQSWMLTLKRPHENTAKRKAFINLCTRAKITFYYKLPLPTHFQEKKIKHFPEKK